MTSTMPGGVCDEDKWGDTNGNSATMIQNEVVYDNNSSCREDEVEGVDHRLSFEEQMKVLKPRGKQWFNCLNDITELNRLPRLLQLLDESDIRVNIAAPESLTNFEAVRTCAYVEAIMHQGPFCPETIEQIEKDLPRTYPDLEFFADTDVHHMLRRVLLCIASEYEQVGYVQGMNFVVSNLLWHTRSEDAAFILFCRMMEHPRYNLSLVYGAGLPKVIRYSNVLDALLLNHLPDLREHFSTLGLEPIYYSQRWIITLFSYTMPFPQLASVWDYFMEIGWEAMFRISLVLLQTHTNTLLASELDTTAQMLREVAEIPVEGLVSKATQLKLTEWEIRLIADSVAHDEQDLCPIDDEEFAQTQDTIQSSGIDEVVS